ncbi:MAG: hypothetical protein LBT55_00410 [Clostridiaceae bacterium]|nr:hypothetical protein [Clostridiaceae bacterium]
MTKDIYENLPHYKVPLEDAPLWDCEPLPEGEAFAAGDIEDGAYVWEVSGNE